MLGVVVLLLVFLVCDYFGIGPLTPTPIPGVPYIRGIPIFGVLYQVKLNSALKYTRWSDIHGDLFQMRMGSRVVVVANSFESVRDLWIKYSNASNSRPMLYTFHSVLSKTQGFTIGTTPYGDTYKRTKRIIATALNKRAVEHHSKFINDECLDMFRRVDEEHERIKSSTRSEDIELFKLIQGYVLRISLFLTYGYLVKVEHNDKCKLFDEIAHVENMIVKLRGHSSNVQDYLPHLRWLGLGNDKTRLADQYRKRRDVYMAKFTNDVKRKIEVGEDYSESIVSKLLRGCSEFPTVTEAELTSVCLTMVSAGLDNTPLVLTHILGHLSLGSYGAKLQETLIDSILKVYGTLENAFINCSDLSGFRVEYISALIEEGLRYFSVLPTSLPRETTRDINYRGVVLPLGTVMFMNAYAANHDASRFEDAFQFKPERYLQGHKGHDDENKHQLPHFSFGAGTRACGGAHLAFKEMYITLLRFIVLYRITLPKDSKYLMSLDPFKTNSCPEAVAIEPFPFKVHLEKRDNKLFERLVHGGPASLV